MTYYCPECKEAMVKEFAKPYFLCPRCATVFQIHREHLFDPQTKEVLSR